MEAPGCKAQKVRDGGMIGQGGCCAQTWTVRVVIGERLSLGQV
jgi:hypothetical protein